MKVFVPCFYNVNLSTTCRIRGNVFIAFYGYFFMPFLGTYTFVLKSEYLSHISSGQVLPSSRFVFVFLL